MDFLSTLKELFYAFLADIRITYVVDVVIIAFVFYSFLKLIRETRAEQIAKGVFIIIVISKLSEWLELYAVEYILKNTLTIGLISVVIIFQPELRKGLEKVGDGGWLIKKNRRRGFHYEDNIDSICEAVTVMSRKKIGALIVIAGKLGLADIIATGTKIDAEISAELVMNIFYPKSPLHDGAMVIKHERIVSAGCVLPLSDMLMSKELGTRHRAAMGMSETSDALIIVVSEETGAISIVADGVLKRFVDPAGLREAITASTSVEEEVSE